jgi:hypothetical protein
MLRMLIHGKRQAWKSGADQLHFSNILIHISIISFIKSSISFIIISASRHLVFSSPSHHLIAARHQVAPPLHVPALRAGPRPPAPSAPHDT